MFLPEMPLRPCGHTPFSAPPDDLPESPAKRRALRAPGSLPRRSAAGPEAAPPSRSRPNRRGGRPAQAPRLRVVPPPSRASASTNTTHLGYEAWKIRAFHFSKRFLLQSVPK